MKPRLDRLPTLAVLAPLIIGVTLLLLFGILFLDGLIYPVFKKVAHMSVPEKEYRVELVGEPEDMMSEEEKEKAKAYIMDTYKGVYGSKYEKYLRKDIKTAREQLGDEAYERAWGPVLKEYEE